MMLRTLFFLALTALPLAPVQATQIIVGNMGFEKIPVGVERRVVGKWFVKALSCTRSIEEVGERYFMTSQCKGKKPDGTGLPIRKMSASLYEGLTSSWTYEVAANGSLIMRSRKGIQLIGESPLEPWPEPK
jgi:hypothetical protein